MPRGQVPTLQRIVPALALSLFLLSPVRDMLQAWLAAFLLTYVVPVLSQDETTCNRSPSEIQWSLGSQGETPCRMWWDLGTVCYWWALAKFPDDVGKYLAPPEGDTCGCNVLAYNLMAACTWAQEEYFNSNWLTEREWSQDCNVHGAYNPVRPSVDLGSRVFPAWAYDSPHGGKWNPTRARSLATKVNATSSSPPPPKTPAPPQQPPPTQSSAQAPSTSSTAIANPPGTSSQPQPLQTSSDESTSPPAMSRSTSTRAADNTDSSSTSLSDTTKYPEGVQSQVAAATSSAVLPGSGGSGRLSTGVLIGAIVGAVAVLAIGMIMLFCFVRRRRRDRPPNAFVPVPSPVQAEAGYMTGKNVYMLERTRERDGMSSEPPPSYTETQNSEY